MSAEPLAVEDYFVDALRLLGDTGSDGLTIAVLCERLGVTKGSFYHHFGAMPAFVTALIGYWEADQAARLTALPRPDGYPAEQLESLVETALDLPYPVERAIRAWGATNADIAAAQARVDRRRERRAADTLVGLGLDRDHARQLARLALSALAGVQLRDEAWDRRRMRLVLDELARLVLRDIPRGRAPRRR